MCTAKYKVYGRRQATLIITVTVIIIIIIIISLSFHSGLVDFKRVRVTDQTFLILNSATNVPTKWHIIIIIIIIIFIIIIITIIEFLTSEVWLGNIHLSRDAAINRIRFGGLICSSESFLQLNVCQE
jgi:uncharacterized protein YpmB